MRIIPEHTLAIAIEYQEHLLPALDDNANFLRNSKILLAGLELLQVPVLVSRQYPQGLGDTVEEIRAVAGKAEVFDKTAFSCYQDAAIKQTVDEFRRRKRENVILCGAEAHVCVLQTALDLLAAGFKVAYVGDCAGSRKLNDKKFALKRAAFEGAALTTYEAVLMELLAGSGHPSFRAVSSLIKQR
jgi:hypothetical protein